MRDLIRALPKAELHLHIEGTLEPDLMFRIANRNGIRLEGTVEDEKTKRNFKDLRDFLNLYYKACDVLKREEDFYDLMYDYLKRAAIDGVEYVEIFFDPQTHTKRGIPFKTVLDGLYKGIVEGQRTLTIKARLIMCFLRDLTEKEAEETLNQSLPYLDKIIAIGLDSNEVDNPPSKFKSVYQQASQLGLKLVAHAGEECGPGYIKEALDVLHVSRVDHGVQCLKDPNLVSTLVERRVPLTVCPLSNKKLKVIDRFFGGQNPVKEMLQKGLMVTINSDDPAYFGSYVLENYMTLVEECGVTLEEVLQLCRNSFDASFMPPQDKELYKQRLDHCARQFSLLPIPKSVAIYGSRSPEKGTEQFEFAREIGKIFGANGYEVINGGYSGTMEASAVGCKEGGGVSTGVITPTLFPHRQPMGNPHLSQIHMTCSPVDRTGKMLESTFHVIVLPGGVGTLGEFFHTWYYCTAVCQRGSCVPKIYLKRDPWESVVKNISSILDISTIQGVDPYSYLVYFDTPDEVYKLIEQNR